MDQKVRQLLLQTLNPNEGIRNNAELQLKSLEKNIEFIKFLSGILMKDSDKMVQQISSIYFMNMMERNWKAPEISVVVAELESNIIALLKTEEKYPKIAYQKILQVIFDNSSKEVIEGIFSSSSAFIASEKIEDNKAALVLYEDLFKSDTLKFNSENILKIIFNQFGNIFISKFSEFLNKGSYSLAGLCMKIISKAYLNYSLPEFLNRLAVAKTFFDIAINILNMQEKNNDGIIKMQRWACYFLYKFANKGLRKYFKNKDFVEFVRKEETLTMLFSTYMQLVTNILNKRKYHAKIPIICSEFFSLIAGNKHSKSLIISNYQFLISTFILPSQEFNEKVSETFEFYPNDYLRERYNFNSSDLRSSTLELFEEIVRCDSNVESDIINSLLGFLNMPINQANAPMRYGIIGLLANSQKNLINVLKENGYYDFVKSHIFTDLISPYKFLVSQSLYFLSLAEQMDIADKSIVDAINIIISYTVSSDEALALEACLSLNVFFYNSALKDSFQPLISKLFEKILILSKTFSIESLSTLMDSMIDCYNSEITTSAPEYVKSICMGFMDKIEADDKDKIATICGYLGTIEKLVVTADDRPEIVTSIYNSTATVIFYIFKNQKSDFYQEAFDLMNSFIFVLKQINQSMFDIFSIALSLDRDDLSLYPREVSDFIDNYLSFARDGIINPESLKAIYNIIDLYMPLNSSEYDVYDEDFEAACRIMDSLLLNAGGAAVRVNQDIIPAILYKLINNYDYILDFDSVTLFALNSIMNCFIVSPEVSLSSLGPFASRFFHEIVVYKSKIRRVYDKKLFVVFIGHIFKLEMPISIDYKELVEVFVETISTLPEAEKKRKKMIEAAEDDEDYSCEDSCASILEDIYFETILDNFDAYNFARTILADVVPKTFGEHFISAMSEQQISRIQNVLENNKN